VIVPDRRSVEGFWTWRKRNAPDFSLRYQDFTDDRHTANPRETRVAGVQLRGAEHPGSRVSGSMRAFVQETSDRAGTVDEVANAASIDLVRSLSHGRTARVGAAKRRAEPRSGSPTLSSVLQRSVGMDRPLRLGAMKGILSLGMLGRETLTRTNQGREWMPSLALALRKGHEEVNLNFAAPRQDWETVATPDVETTDLQVRYKHTYGERTVGVDYSRYDRRDETGRFTKAFQVAAYYAKRFGRIYGGKPTRPKQAAKGRLDPTAFALGGTLEQACKVVEGWGVGAPSVQGDLRVYEAAVFDDVPGRQRLVLVGDGDRLARASVAVEVESPVESRDLQDAFERVRRSVVKRYGSPVRDQSFGEPLPDMVAQIRSGAYWRVMEWNVDGGALRLGIPRRLDGALRIEVQFAPSFPPVEDTYWGVEALR
jgi:hypothetical protein